MPSFFVGGPLPQDPWIRPDWKNPSEYPDPNRPNQYRLAWEFLRRSSRYHEDVYGFRKKMPKATFTKKYEQCLEKYQVDSLPLPGSEYCMELYMQLFCLRSPMILPRLLTFEERTKIAKGDSVKPFEEWLPYDLLK